MGKSLVARLFAALSDKEIEELKHLIYEHVVPVKERSIEFDWNIPYKKYPRKIGKSTGIVKLRRSVRNGDDYGMLLQAVENYAAYAKKNSLEPQFIMHFSTFATRWRDWTDAALDKAGVSRSLVPSFSQVLSND